MFKIKNYMKWEIIKLFLGTCFNLKASKMKLSVWFIALSCYTNLYSRMFSYVSPISQPLRKFCVSTKDGGVIVYVMASFSPLLLLPKQHVAESVGKHHWYRSSILLMEIFPFPFTTNKEKEQSPAYVKFTVMNKSDMYPMSKPQASSLCHANVKCNNVFDISNTAVMVFHFLTSYPSSHTQVYPIFWQHTCLLKEERSRG